MTTPPLQLVSPAAKAATPAPSDEHLMLEARAGTRRAFATLVSRYERNMRRFCTGLLGNTDEGDEAAQQAFLDLWRSRGRYQASHPFRALLFTVARNRCRTILRRRALVSFVSLADAEPPAETGTEGAYAQAQQYGLVRQELERLPEKFRTPLLLRFVEELTYDEISRVIGRKPATARTRVHYGLKRLAQRLPPEVRPWSE